jgi:hypothetical protein
MGCCRLVILFLMLLGVRGSARERSLTLRDRPWHEPLTVVLLDQASLHGETLGRVRQLVSGIFRDVGIDITWRNRVRLNVGDTEDPGDGHPENAGFTIHMVIRFSGPTALGISGELGRYRSSSRRAPPIVGTTIGATHESGGTAFVYVEPIARAVNGRSADVATLLASTMAHEMGHVLLPYPAHTSSGIMRDAWDENDLALISHGAVRFTPVQAVAMRRKIAWFLHKYSEYGIIINGGS